MAWEWLTAGVVPGLSIAGAIWTARQQRQSSDRQIKAQQDSTQKQLNLQRQLASDSQAHELRLREEERTWAKREETLLRLVKVARNLDPMDEPTALVKCVYDIRDHLAEIELYTGQDVRTAAMDLYRVIVPLANDEQITSKHYTALELNAKEMAAVRGNDSPLRQSLEALRVKTEDDLMNLIVEKIRTEGVDVRTPARSVVSAARREMNESRMQKNAPPGT